MLEASRPPGENILRVVHFIDVLGPGGKERQLVELLKGFAARGDCESLVVCMSETIFFTEIASIPRVQLTTLVRRWRFDPRPVWRLIRLAREFRAQTLVVWDFLTAVYAIPCAISVVPRTINHLIQDAPARLPRKIAMGARLSFPFAHRIVANSQAGLDAYGVHGRDGVVIRNGFDWQRTEGLEDPARVRERCGFGNGLVVGMVSTFRAWKDQPTFIRAAELLLAARHDAIFVLVGDGETLAACKAMVAPAFLDAIRFTGLVHDGLESLVSTFDVAVLATYTEGISNSIMEYMALAKPVVATDGGGTRELVIDGVTGFLVRAQDPPGLARRIDQLLSDATLRADMGRAGRARIAAEFSLSDMVARHAQVYRK